MSSIPRYDELPQEIRILVAHCSITATWYEADRSILTPFDYRLGLLCNKTRGDPAAALLNLDWIQISVLFNEEDDSIEQAVKFQEDLREILPSALPDAQHFHAGKPILFLTMQVVHQSSCWSPSRVAKYLIPFDQRELCGIGRMITINENTAQLIRLELVTPEGRSQQALQIELLPLVAFIRNCKGQLVSDDHKSVSIAGLDEYHTKLAKEMITTSTSTFNAYLIWAQEIFKFAEYEYSISLGHGERACYEAALVLTTPKWEAYDRVHQITQSLQQPDGNQSAFLLCKLALLSLEKQNEQWQTIYKPGMTYQQLRKAQGVFEDRATAAMRFVGLHGHDRELVHIQAGLVYFNLARLIHEHFPKKQRSTANALFTAGVHFQSGALISGPESQKHTLLEEVNTELKSRGYEPVVRADAKAEISRIGGVKEYIPKLVKEIWDRIHPWWGVGTLRARTVLQPEQQEYPHNWELFVAQWMADEPLTQC